MAESDNNGHAYWDEEFLSLISHELRAPLTVISGYAQLLDRRLARQDLHDEATYAQLIKEQVSRISRMVGDIIELSRFESGIGDLQLEPVKLGDLVNLLVPRLRSELRSNASHTFAIDVPTKLPTLQADPRRLEQTLSNILINALRYSPNGGEIRISAAPENGGGRLAVRVSDRGIGVPDSEKERVFERGYRGMQARALVAQGLGLGLYICKLLTEAHGGKVGVEDGPGGVGTTCWFTLPVQA